MGLNENQKRRLTSYLLHVEKSLDRMTDLLHGSRAEGIFYRVEDNLSPSQKLRLLELFSNVRQGLEVLARRFSVSQRKELLHSLVAAELSQNWTILENLYSGKLKGLGSVSEDLRKSLDPEIVKLVNFVNGGFDTLRTQKLDRGPDQEMPQDTPHEN